MEGVTDMGLNSFSIFYQKSKSNRPLILRGSYLVLIRFLAVYIRFLFDFGRFF
jgi:hypothetical protein